MSSVSLLDLTTSRNLLGLKHDYFQTVLDVSGIDSVEIAFMLLERSDVKLLTGTGLVVAIDNICAEPVPEPVSMLLLATGLADLGAMRHRRSVKRHAVIPTNDKA